jgi:hypothetical protein
MMDADGEVRRSHSTEVAYGPNHARTEGERPCGSTSVKMCNVNRKRYFGINELNVLNERCGICNESYVKIQVA